MNSSHEAFVHEAQSLAAAKGVPWLINLTEAGTAFDKHGWNLNSLVNVPPPPNYWLNDLGTDARTISVLNDSPQPGPVRIFSKERLTEHWEDLLKSAVIDQLLVRKNTCGHVVSNVIRPLRVLATCAPGVEPWELTLDHVMLAVETARKIQASGKLADLVIGVVRSVLDANHLTDAGPLFPFLERDQNFHMRVSKFAKANGHLRSKIDERKDSEKLPDRRAFWELVRVVYTETPQSFLDFQRFAQVKALLLTGIRDGECCLLPVDWKRFKEYVDANNQHAASKGAISRELGLRHFAEKQRIVYENSNLLFETTQHVPEAFQQALTEALDQAAVATEPLRATLKQQVETGRILPFFHRDELVSVQSLYTHLTGNPFIVATERQERLRWVERYQHDYAPEVFDDLRREQMELARQGVLLDSAFYVYYRRLHGVTFRTSSGLERPHPTAERTRWSELYLRVDEVEDYLSSSVSTKLSDTQPLKLAERELSTWELLFLMPKRALADVKEAGLCDITRYYSVGRMDRQMITDYLATGRTMTLFSRYGQTDTDRKLTLRPHSLRHLQNTEYFRLGLADTIITKQFDRRTVAQSYEYDHRSLAEDLDAITLPDDLEEKLGESSATVARLIKSGRARGPIVDAFRRIQEAEGEDAAFEYLRAEADGFHATPYGHCVNSFMVDPCPQHLECFNECKHLSATDLGQTRNNLVQLETRLTSTVETLSERKLEIDLARGGSQLKRYSPRRPNTSSALDRSISDSLDQPTKHIGLDNQLAHAQQRLKSVRKLLSTPSGQLVFPDGRDIYAESKKGGTVLDGFE